VSWTGHVYLNNHVILETKKCIYSQLVETKHAYVSRFSIVPKYKIKFVLLSDIISTPPIVILDSTPCVQSAEISV
jgi:hypothetical protein